MKIDPHADIKIDTPSLLAVCLIAFWALALVTGLGTPRGWITDTRGIAVEGDFNGVYTAGSFALNGEPLAAYDWERHKQAQHELVANPNGNFYPWPYPPSFLIIAAMLATLPYSAAMLTWTLATLAAYAAAIARITTSRRHLLAMLAVPAPWLNLYVGQNGALTAALVGFGLILMPARPIAAGVCLGLLSIKPHLALLVPIALMAGGYWRTLAAAAATATILALLTSALFGVEPWLAMPDQLQRVVAIFKSTAMPEKIQSIFGFARALGVSIETAMAGQILLAGLLIVGLAWLWRQRDVAFDLKAAALATAMTLASPYQFVYDLVILGIAQAFLLRATARQGSDPLQAAVLIIANILIFLFAAAPVPLGIFASVIVMMLIARRITSARRSAPEPNILHAASAA